MHIIRGLPIDGNEVFYAGGTGESFVSADRGKAFAYASQDVARTKAATFNRMTAVHGMRFIAIQAGHIDHKGCECADCWTRARDRHDALAILHQANREGGDQILLGSIVWHVEERVELARRIEYQAKYGSIMETYVGYRQ